MTPTLVPHDALDVLWPLLWPLLERAARRAKPAAKEADVRAAIESGHAEVWAVIENSRPIAAITTEITLLPERRCRIWLVGGARMAEWAAGFMTMIERWARDHGCKAIYGEQTRPGWARIVEQFGGAPFDAVSGTPAWARRLA